MGKKYENEFKRMVAELILSGRPVKEVSEEYGLNDSMIRRWRRELEEEQSGFQRPTSLSKEEQEIKRLRKELVDIKEERDILKKAVSIFSKRDA